MIKSRRSCTERKATANRYLEAARRIAEGEAFFVAFGSATGALVKIDDESALIKFAGDTIFVDDNGGLYPTDESAHDRVIFLCTAAAAAERP